MGRAFSQFRPDAGEHEDQGKWVSGLWAVISEWLANG